MYDWSSLENYTKQVLLIEKDNIVILVKNDIYYFIMSILKFVGLFFYKQRM